MKKVMFFFTMFLASFVLQAQDTDVIDNLNLVDVQTGNRGNIFLGGKTDTGDNGMRLFGGGNYAGFIDAVSNSSTDGLRFRVDQNIGSSERMRIAANGRVGIGITTPAQRLHVKGRIRASYASDLSEYVEIYHGGSHGFINTAGDGNLDFRHNNSTKMSLTEVGNLGIGTTTPTEKFHVNNGNAIIDGLSTGVGLTVSKNTVEGMIALFKNSQNQRIFLSPEKTVPGAANPICQIGDAGIHWSDALLSGAKNQSAALVIAPHSFNTAGMRLHADGKIQIGNVSTPGNYKLYVDDGILTEKVKVATVNSADWADYVFDEDYDLNSTEEVETFIKENKHLPNVPSAQKVSENGVDMVEMDATLLRQIEELWLHVIELKKENEALKEEVKVLKKS